MYLYFLFIVFTIGMGQRHPLWVFELKLSLDMFKV